MLGMSANNMPALSATSSIVIRRLSKIIFFTAAMFPLLVAVPGLTGRTSSLSSSRHSLNQLHLNWTCVPLIVDSPNATANISNVIAHLISFFTQNLIAYLQELLSGFFFYLLNLSKMVSIGMIGLWFQYHRHTLRVRHQLWPFWANLDRRLTSSTSPEQCPC